jgi:hypothetical protein
MNRNFQCKLTFFFDSDQTQQVLDICNMRKTNKGGRRTHKNMNEKKKKTREQRTITKLSTNNTPDTHMEEKQC